MNKSTNIFDLHKDILDDYKSYIDGFLNIADPKILDTVRSEFDSGNLYPEPLIQFNPSFESGGKVEDLVNAGSLESQFNDIFYDDKGNSWSIYKHQTEAILKGNEGKGFVVTSGTGSGKSLTYISTIFNHLFKKKSSIGIKAIIVYPLNALINSQFAALTEFETNFIKRTGQKLPFTYGKYTGQEKQEDRERMILNPPNILLTNYMMLELLMVRKSDELIRKSFLENLDFLVYDELHVYKGRQGADVSMLNRRIKASATNKNIICIGTSATMATGTVEEQKLTVAQVASRFFADSFSSESVIVESLTYSTIDLIPTKDDLCKVLNNPITNDSKEKLISNALAIWLEREIAVKKEGEFKKRNTPKSLSIIAAELSQVTGCNIEICKQKIVEILIWAEKINIESVKARKKDSILPFRLHQFISQTGYVYLTLESRENRYATLEPNPFIKREGYKEDIPVFQTVFSRISGEEFICVRKDFEGDQKFVFRDFDDNKNPKNEDDLKKNSKKIDSRELNHYTDGYVVIEKDTFHDINDYLDLLPSSFVKNDKIIPSKEFLLPKVVYVNIDGSYSETPNGGVKGWFVPAPLVFDLTSGVIYQDSKLSEKTKLISLGNEGRSTSTTLLTLQTLLALHRHDKELKEQKVMSFTDNRQDASLQAGHFNDFIQVVQLRSAIEKVLSQENKELTIHELIYKVQDTLKLDESEFAKNPSTHGNERNRKIFRDYISYRIIQDLKRGWRYILPNLEQTALLEITYDGLEKHCSQDSIWNSILLLNNMNFEERRDFVLQILNYFRNLYAVDIEMLRYENRLRIQDELNNELNKDKLWSLDRGEKLDAPNYLSVDGHDKASREVFVQSIGSQSRLSKFIKLTFRNAGLETPTSEQYKEFLTDLLELLKDLNYLRKEKIAGEKGEKIGYQLILSSVLWKKGDGENVIIDRTAYTDLGGELLLKPHSYFKKLYKEDFINLPKSYIAAEHTGQISNEQKVEREKKFSDAKELSALYCSPTMELGIDISSLNIVHMRNVPPNPANYAQRSGRAGRSGQSALVFTYASKVSPHDKNYFNDPVKMVAGIVQAPRIDLTNEELIKSHINATVISLIDAPEFTSKLTDLIDLSSGGSLKLKKELKDKYQDAIDGNYSEIKRVVLNITKSIGGLDEAKWYSDSWLDKQIKGVPTELEERLLRWRKMYVDALNQMNEAHKEQLSPIIKDKDKKREARISYARAIERKKLLENNLDRNGGSTLSEFYTFRYLASEGFFPGYNFTRLPIRVFLGGRDTNESISRPRFIGLKEFGPNNIIYHNGGKYKITRITPNDVSLDLTELKISKETNYAFYGKDEGKGKNQDPITGVQFTAGNTELIQNLLELEEAQSENSERISCMEEVRSSEGYEMDMYLNSTNNLIDATKISLRIEGDELMKLFFSPASRLILVNKKWRKSKDEGFDIGTRSGFFKSKKQLENPNPDDPSSNVKLFTYDTSDVLYIQPVKSLGLTEEGVISLQYALLKAIEQIYNIESVEVRAQLMGEKESKNIMIYESSEGSIGVLKDIARTPIRLQEIFKKAYEICGYRLESHEDSYPNRPKASYDDLLSYYNQRDHGVIDRHSIISALELLLSSKSDDTVGSTYEEKYAELTKGVHPKSPGEKVLLDYLFENGFKLPNYTNFNLEKFYIQPDFVYSNENALVFVDGGIHKNGAIKADDDKKRKALELAGFDVLVWDDTSESVESFVSRRQDIFRKVR